MTRIKDNCSISGITSSSKETLYRYHIIILAIILTAMGQDVAHKAGKPTASRLFGSLITFLRCANHKTGKENLTMAPKREETAALVRPAPKH